ncbi:hypothetical protein C8R45DRAFT_1099535 [Mycena sanguinolenta]|nr:hypothetical protein C8R45DRAFT_1099535 [Mycena sanguinolenta]
MPAELRSGSRGKKLDVYTVPRESNSSSSRTSNPRILALFLFGSITVTEDIFHNLVQATFRPYVREVALGVRLPDPHLPNILEQLPAFETLRLTTVYPDHPGPLLPTFNSLTSLNVAVRRRVGGDSGLPALFRVVSAFPMLERLQTTKEEEYNSTGPFNLPARTTLGSLPHLRTLLLDCPMLNTQILDSSHCPHSKPFISRLLCFPRDPPRDMRIGRLRTAPTPTELRSLQLCAPVSHRALLEIAAHVLERALAAERLQRLMLEMEQDETNNRFKVDDADTIKSAREAHNRVLGKPTSFEWMVSIVRTLAEGQDQETLAK